MRGLLSSRTFRISFFLTVLILLFLIGIFTVDSEGRRLTFNDGSPPFEVLYGLNGTASLRVNAFSWGREFDFTFPVRVWHFIADFLCIPHGGA